MAPLPAASPWLRTVFSSSAAIAFALAASSLAAREVDVTNHVTLAMAAMSPYLTVIALMAVLLFVLGRRWWATAAASVLATAAVAVQGPRFVADGPVDGVAVRVLTANVRTGLADAGALAELARSSADVVVLQELTPELAGEIETRIGADFPYRATEARAYASGSGLWSRYPISRTRHVDGFQLATLTAAIAVPGLAAETVVLVTHIAGPWPQPINGWRRELDLMRSTFSSLAAEAGNGSVIVAGDFNATYDMAPFRRLLRDGFRDAAEQSGAGLTRTFSAVGPLPPLIGIDHIIVRNGGAGDVRTVPVPGSDHRGLVATVRLSVPRAIAAP